MPGNASLIMSRARSHSFIVLGRGKKRIPVQHKALADVQRPFWQRL